MRSFCVVLVLVLTMIAGVAYSQVTLENAFPNLSFTFPTDIQNAGDGSNWLYVSEWNGAIWVFDNDASTTTKTLFLDLSGLVNEVIGFAFHPDLAANPYVYVNHGDLAAVSRRIARFTITLGSPPVAMAGTRVDLISVNPIGLDGGHDGGQIAFGPDSLLYIPLGDGGDAGDPQGNAQNRANLLGSVVRIDVDNPSGGLNYGIPGDNPYVGNGNGWREEIWAYGFRNPFRCSFDPATGALWLGDVGQASREEIDIVESAGNYGWNTMEGSLCFNPASGCDTTGLALPFHELPQPESECIVGGVVYRSAHLPSLTGRYIFGDCVNGNIWALDFEGVSTPAHTLLLDSNLDITSFGQDEAGNLFVCAFSDNSIYRFTNVATAIGDPALSYRSTLQQNHPNPFNPITTIRFTIARRGNVQLDIFDTSGQLIRTLVNETMRAGPHELDWDGSNEKGGRAASGVYFYRLRVDSRVAQTRRMVLLK